MGITRKGTFTPGTRLSWCPQMCTHSMEQVCGILNKIKYRGIRRERKLSCRYCLPILKYYET